MSPALVAFNSIVSCVTLGLIISQWVTTIYGNDISPTIRTITFWCVCYMAVFWLVATWTL